MSSDKYPSIFLPQMEAIVYISENCQKWAIIHTLYRIETMFLESKYNMGPLTKLIFLFIFNCANLTYFLGL